jgi:hypothetical protein
MNELPIEPPNALDADGRDIYTQIRPLLNDIGVKCVDMPIVVSYISAIVMKNLALLNLQIAPVTPDGKISPYHRIWKDNQEIEKRCAEQLGATPKIRAAMRLEIAGKESIKDGLFAKLL